MKSLALCALFLTPNFNTEPLRLTGEYALQELRVVKSWRQETLDTRTAPGKARAEELRAAGWECVRKSVFDVCRGGEASPIAESELAYYREQAEARGPLLFGTAVGEPSIWNDAETHIEFMHEQSITWQGLSRPRFRVYQSDDVAKLNILDAVGNFEDALVIAEGELIHSTKIHRSRGAMVVDVYLFEEVYRLPLR